MNGGIVALCVFANKVQGRGCRVRGLAWAGPTLRVREDATHVVADGGESLIKKGSDKFIEGAE